MEREVQMMKINESTKGPSMNGVRIENGERLKIANFDYQWVHEMQMKWVPKYQRFSRRHLRMVP